MKKININNPIPCCPDSSECCQFPTEKKKLVIDFMYLDLTVCERCQGTESGLEEAINDVSAVLNSAGYEVILNKININTKELAIEHEFLSSPTIRINGKDIVLETTETPCKDCGDLCGDNVDCRSWVYEGKEYNEPPKAMIVNAILKEVYGGSSSKPRTKEEYVIPENLEVFFEGLKKG